MEYKEFRKIMKERNVNEDSLQLLDEIVNNRKSKDIQFDKKEFISDRRKIEIEQKKTAQEYLNQMLTIKMLSLICAGNLVSTPNLEESTLNNSKSLFSMYKNLDEIYIDYQEDLDRHIDVERWTELLDFVQKNYGDRIKEEYNENKCGTISTNAKVYKLLVSGTFVQINYSAPLSEVFEWFDYSVFILHYVKALEKFLVYKLNNKKILSEKEYEEITMHKIIEKIKNNKAILFKPDVPNFAEEYYFELLDKFRKNYRNGHMHRDILSYDKALYINDMILSILVITDLFLV